MNKDLDSQIHAIRDASQYFAAHQNKKAIIVLPSEILNSVELTTLLGDITLLSKAAQLQFAICFDVLEQAKEIANAIKVDTSSLSAGMCVVSKDQLESIKIAVNTVRDNLELALACDVGRIKGIGSVVGKKLEARTAGVIHGKHLGAMGIPKEIDTTSITSLFNTGSAVLIPPLGQGIKDEVLHLDVTEISLALAKASTADKLILFASQEKFKLLNNLNTSALSLQEVKKLINDKSLPSELINLFNWGIKAIEAGVNRVHYINQDVSGSLLLELLTPNNEKVGFLLSKDEFENIRIATSNDAAAILDLIAPGIEQGAILPRDLTSISQNAKKFAVVALDDALIACASLEVHAGYAEFGCLAVRSDFANQDYANLLLEFFLTQAKQDGIKSMVAITTQAIDWFRERGFVEDSKFPLEPQRIASIEQRQAVILVKQIS